MLSWAVPRGPSYDPKDMRMAIHIKGEPLTYNRFEGTIPPKQYGAGTVIVWDHGTWEPTVDPHQGLKDVKVVFALHGHKLVGLWELERIAKPGDKQEAWLLFKKRDRRASTSTRALANAGSVCKWPQCWCVACCRNWGCKAGSRPAAARACTWWCR